MSRIEGKCSNEFAGVKEAFAKNLNSGEDIGASAAVFIDGEPVVDIWGGYFDEARTRPWDRDTIVNNFSTTKTMTALCALILADRGGARSERSSQEVLAGIRRCKQGARYGQTFSGSHLRTCRLDRNGHSRGHL